MDLSAFLVALVPGAAAIVSAIVATRAASRARASDAQAQRVRDLENRIAQKKHDTYEPMIDLLAKALDPQTSGELASQKARALFAKFDAWIAIYGSDDAVEAWQRFRQGMFHDPPPFVTMRLYAEFVLAARRDMGHPDSGVTALDVLGMRINDLYDSGGDDLADVLSLPWPEAAGRYGWTIPWPH